jgi:FKBP-type peptidyl-prolyl cis-trans isomerase SlyD
MAARQCGLQLEESSMNIENNSVVTLQYVLTDSDGNEIHATTADEPMVYLHGWGEIIDGLETALAGKRAGEELEANIEPADGYGEEDPELVSVFQKDDFGDADMQVGMELQGKDPDGNFQVLRVIKIEGDDVTVNMNHPLAGKSLKFAVRIEDVRAATETELAHGHVHMEGDEHH